MHSSAINPISFMLHRLLFKISRYSTQVAVSDLLCHVGNRRFASPDQWTLGIVLFIAVMRHSVQQREGVRRSRLARDWSAHQPMLITCAECNKAYNIPSVYKSSFNVTTEIGQSLTVGLHNSNRQLGLHLYNTQVQCVSLNQFFVFTDFITFYLFIPFI